jgi:hypothetical protein
MTICFLSLLIFARIECECDKAELVLRGDKGGVKIIENGTITINDIIAIRNKKRVMDHLSRVTMGEFDQKRNHKPLFSSCFL